MADSVHVMPCRRPATCPACGSSAAPKLGASVAMCLTPRSCRSTTCQLPLATAPPITDAGEPACAAPALGASAAPAPVRLPRSPPSASPAPPASAPRSVRVPMARVLPGGPLVGCERVLVRGPEEREDLAVGAGLLD